MGTYLSVRWIRVSNLKEVSNKFTAILWWLCIQEESIDFVCYTMFYFIFAGTYKITESFLYPIGQLAVDPRIHVLIQKEVYNNFSNFF